MSLETLIQRNRIFCCEEGLLDVLCSIPYDSFIARDELRPIVDVKRFAELNPSSFFTVSFRLRGGKGGFGTLLRSFRINKSSNQLMCRDLNGRRLADVEEEKKLKKWVENASDREKTKAEKKKAKYEKLRAATQDKPKHDFNDPDYIQKREEILEKTEDAFDAGFEHFRRNKRKKQPAKKDESSDSSDSDSDKPGPSTSHKSKRKCVRSFNEGPSDLSEGNLPEIEDIKDEESNHVLPESGKEKKVEEEKVVEVKTEEVKKVEVKTDEVKKVEEVPKDFPTVDLDEFSSKQELESLGLHHLRHALESRGLKCGGSLEERAKRLFSVKGLMREHYPKGIIAPPPKGNKK